MIQHPSPKLIACKWTTSLIQSKPLTYEILVVSGNGQGADFETLSRARVIRGFPERKPKTELITSLIYEHENYWVRQFLWGLGSVRWGYLPSLIKSRESARLKVGRIDINWLHSASCVLGGLQGWKLNWNIHFRLYYLSITEALYPAVIRVVGQLTGQNLVSVLWCGSLTHVVELAYELWYYSKTATPYAWFYQSPWTHYDWQWQIVAHCRSHRCKGATYADWFKKEKSSTLRTLNKVAYTEASWSAEISPRMASQLFFIGWFVSLIYHHRMSRCLCCNHSHLTSTPGPWPRVDSIFEGCEFDESLQLSISNSSNLMLRSTSTALCKFLLSCTDWYVSKANMSLG